ncbi:Cupredoxin [Gorgonomyces haynaldii]|nr:Cupredoxin [Gorgonomyces haynaldii]
MFFIIPSVSAATFNVTISGLTFNPSSLNVNIGDTVIWNFAAAQHTVTQVASGTAGDCKALANGFDSKLLVAPNTFKQTFTAAGNFWYVCSIAAHCAAGMRGVVRVSQPTATSAQAPSATATGASKTWTMQVAPTGALAFAMPTIQINQGDSITWQFAAKNHTVTEVSSGAASDCTPKQGGYDSGLQVAPAVYTRTFNTLGKSWYICYIAAHCAAGMRGTIEILPVGTAVNNNSTSTTTCPAGYVSSSQAQPSQSSPSPVSVGYLTVGKESVPAGCVPIKNDANSIAPAALAALVIVTALF